MSSLDDELETHQVGTLASLFAAPAPTTPSHPHQPFRSQLPWAKPMPTPCPRARSLYEFQTAKSVPRAWWKGVRPGVLLRPRCSPTLRQDEGEGLSRSRDGELSRADRGRTNEDADSKGREGRSVVSKEVQERGPSGVA